ncbi:GPO family capsid scaffolding protein [Dickeya lacustris]|uniref:GPO family capsid scaffolding protein n=1 Tax=Dickeya lacustris TaxID=2259638 RepID=A0ABY8G6D7_9GAMM|nr:GPO family capsid scaffolding protein [Dickeya lacustris]WFN55526.1 GPO family capsid scaffolding protein [Dickeya lacustris]
MSATTQPARKKFRVAVSGSTVDGREISPEHLRDAAASYRTDVYGARVNVEHYLSMLPNSEFGAMGDVTALSTEDITEGPLAGRTALYAEIEPSARMKQLTDEGKKVYSSIELHPQFALNGKAYVVGLAMTDTPASLGTERLKFTAQQRAQIQAFNKQQGDAPLFSDAIEAEIIELASQNSDAGKQWFSRVMGIIGKGRKSDSEQFTQVHEAVENIAQSHADLLDSFNTLKTQQQQDNRTIQTLTGELAALTQKLATQDNSYSQRPAASGGNSSVQLADF